MIVFSSSNQLEVRLLKGCNYYNRLSKFVVVQFGSIKTFSIFLLNPYPFLGNKKKFIYRKNVKRK